MGFAVGAPVEVADWAGVGLWVGAVLEVAVAVGDDDVVCVGVEVAVVAGVVGLAVWAGAVVGAACVAGLDADCVGVGVADGVAVAAGVVGAFVGFPASDAVECTWGVPAWECEVSRTAITATMTAAAPVRPSQRHRRSGDGGQLLQKLHRSAQPHLPRPQLREVGRGQSSRDAQGGRSGVINHARRSSPF